MKEFNTGETLEALVARDADHLSLILELKALSDLGHRGPEAWLPHVVGRLRTEVGKRLAKEILQTASDAWWFEEREDPCQGV